MYTKIGALESSGITDIRVSEIATPEETQFYANFANCMQAMETSSPEV